MKKVLCFSLLLFLTIGTTLYAQKSNSDLKGEAVAASKKAEKAAEAIANLCDEAEKDADAIRTALDQAREAAEAAREAADAVHENSLLKDDAVRAAEAAEEAFENAKATAGGMQIEHWVEAYCKEIKKKIEDSDELCPGERGTASNLFDDVMAEATRLAEEHPCDSLAVREGLETYINNRHENGCSKLQEFIEDYFTIYHILGGDRFFLPEDAMVWAEASGRTTGQIGTMFFVNNTDETQTYYVPASYVLGRNGDQPFETEEIITIAPPHSTVEEPIIGYCTRVDRPAPNANSNMPINTFIARPPTPANGATLPENGWVIDPDSELINPVTGEPLGMSIDFDAHPDQSWFLFEAGDLIEQNYENLLSSGQINPLFGSTPQEKADNYLQQARWDVYAEAYGFDYEFDNFLTNGLALIESIHNIVIDDLSNEQQEQVEEPFVIAWEEISIVGGVMKVPQEQDAELIDVTNNECGCGTGSLTVDVYVDYQEEEGQVEGRTKLGTFSFESTSNEGVQNTLPEELSEGDQIYLVIRDVEANCTACNAGNCYSRAISITSTIGQVQGSNQVLSGGSERRPDVARENAGIYTLDPVYVAYPTEDADQVETGNLLIHLNYTCDSFEDCNDFPCVQNFVLKINRRR